MTSPAFSDTIYSCTFIRKTNEEAGKVIAQILAVVIFIAMFVLIVLEVWERHVITLGCGLLTLVLVFGLGMHSMGAVWETLNLGSFFTSHFWYTAGQSAETSSGINWETIVFVAGMMIMVEGMARVGFFRWLCMRLAKMVKYKVVPLFVTFMVLSGILAMFIDSITVILFLGYSFTDFLTNTGLIAGISLVVVVLYFYLVFHKELRASEAAAVGSNQTYPDPSEAITDKKGFIISTVIFLCAVALLVTHAQTGLTVSCIGVFITIVTLIAAGRDALKLIKQIDYKTLLFFIGLFMVVGGLEQTGILKVMANFIGDISNGNLMLMIAIILWISAIASAFVDNIPFAATMIPIISSLSAAQGVDLSILAWALAMGTDIGGSATPIGASANVVGIATAAKAGHMIKWGKYCKVMAPATIIVIVISMVMIYARYL